MNPRLEWAVPVAAGLITGLALWGLTAGSEGDGHDDGTGHSDTGTATEAPPALLVPFDFGIGVDGEALTFTILAPQGKAAALAEANATGAGGTASRLVWQGDRVAFLDVPVMVCEAPSSAMSCDSAVGGPRPFPLTVAGGAPFLFRDGHNATRVTAYVFDEAGLLLASNANDTARHTLHDDFVRLPSTAWYLGANATAPNGTSHLPGFAKPLVDRVRPQLDGLPVGGVASVRSNAYAALYGSLFVTVRVDALVLAP